MDELDSFVRSHGTALFRLAVLLTGSRADAEDLVQDALIRLAGRLDRLGVDEQLPYARRVVVNLFLDGRRRSRRFISIRHLLGPPTRTVEPEDDVVRRSVVHEEILRLPRQQRAAVILRYWADLTEIETATALGIGIGTVKSHTARALATLRVRLADGIDETEESSHA